MAIAEEPVAAVLEGRGGAHDAVRQSGRAELQRLPERVELAGRGPVRHRWPTTLPRQAAHLAPGPAGDVRTGSRMPILTRPSPGNGLLRRTRHGREARERRRVRDQLARVRVLPGRPITLARDPGSRRRGPRSSTITRSAIVLTSARLCVTNRIASCSRCAEVLEELDDRRLHGDVERGGDLVADQHLAARRRARVRSRRAGALRPRARPGRRLRSRAGARRARGRRPRARPPRARGGRRSARSGRRRSRRSCGAGSASCTGLWKMYWRPRRRSAGRLRDVGARRRCPRSVTTRRSAGRWRPMIASRERRLAGAGLADERQALPRPRARAKASWRTCLSPVERVDVAHDEHRLRGAPSTPLFGDVEPEVAVRSISAARKQATSWLCSSCDDGRLGVATAREHLCAARREHAPRRAATGWRDVPGDRLECQPGRDVRDRLDRACACTGGPVE